MKLFKKKVLEIDQIYFLQYFKSEPRFYRLPNILKASVSLCPVVSYQFAFVQSVKNFLSLILSSLVVNRYSVCNFKRVVDSFFKTSQYHII